MVEEEEDSEAGGDATSASAQMAAKVDGDKEDRLWVDGDANWVRSTRRRADGEEDEIGGLGPHVDYKEI